MLKKAKTRLPRCAAQNRDRMFAGCGAVTIREPAPDGFLQKPACVLSRVKLDNHSLTVVAQNQHFRAARVSKRYAARHTSPEPKTRRENLET